MYKIKHLLFLFTLVFLLASCKEKIRKDTPVENNQNQTNEKILPEEIVKNDFLPPIGKWMYTSELKYANWLGAKFNGKFLREPINIIIVDSISKSIDEAKSNLIKNFNTAGFEIRKGHSGGYLGYIENKFYTQLPEQSGCAFSDEPFEINNCHGRVFGPCEINGVYYFTASLSKEKVVVDIPIHHYDSFNQARNKLANNLDSKTRYKKISEIEMFNSINTDSLTTGDHDGKGILISVSK
jgi:hypothetical protein